MFPISLTYTRPPLDIEPPLPAHPAGLEALADPTP